MINFSEFDVSELEEMDQEEVAFIRSLVEGFFGPPHPAVQFEGVFFYDRRHPMNFYPLPYSQFRVAVCLPDHQADEPLARLVHLSHELVHCLTPNGMPPGQATVLEEGLGEHVKIYLAEQCYQVEFPDFDFKSMLVGKYKDAFYEVEDLIASVGLERMRQGIRSLREKTGLPFAHITKAHLGYEFPNAPPSILERLSQPFH